ncbi:hypothetical protein B1R32_10229 [Abditibacterium utsteinense]|uniref:Uncharacterized protein n=1 Tax=Abditibacterium utsteinense TaxID=1960156 RepID=A0A2S8SW53_9BACT|nr:hypothetical protein [Abditibacterium utsteinense]PQV65022.1 hypothetical protein B1R32_10229 [Abditibacterium utsteinense]
MRTFRFLPPSPQETRAFYVFAAGAFAGQLMAFSLVFIARDSGKAALAVGAGLAILVRFGFATWQFDTRRRRAQKARIELENNGIRIISEQGSATFVRFDEMDVAESKNGKMNLEFRGQKYAFGAREIENGMGLTQEILRRVAKPQSISNYIPLEPM